jgi:branched-chain amino acid transport system permease protein
MKALAAVAGLVALALLPLWMPGGSYDVNIASQVLIWAAFALGLDILVGYAGLVSLGQAGLFGFSCYAAAWLVAAGTAQWIAALAAIGFTLVLSAVFAVLSLRGTGISFLMITLTLGEIVWGIAQRWVSLTGGDNGISVTTRPAPFGISLNEAVPFFYATLVMFLVVLGLVARFVHSPLGVALRGTRDQPRRMNALGYNVWMIRFLGFLASGLAAAVAGLFFFYYNEFVSPHVLSLTTSAEVVLMVIAGGAATLLGPIVGAALVVVMQGIVSSYIAHWNLVLGVIFVAIILFMPEGLVPGLARLVRGAVPPPGAPQAASRVGLFGRRLS